MRSNKLILAAASSLALMVLAPAAHADVNPIVVDEDPSDSFGNDDVICTVIDDVCTFSDSFLFDGDPSWTLQSISIETSFNTGNPITDLDLEVILLNGVQVPLVFDDDILELAFLGQQPLLAVGNNLIIIGTGTPGGNGSYTGTATFAAAVPELSTWAMMLLGFGAVGHALRASRRTKIVPSAA